MSRPEHTASAERFYSKGEAARYDDSARMSATQRALAEGVVVKSGGGSHAPTVAVDSLGPKDRERVLELLLSQERVAEAHVLVGMLRQARAHAHARACPSPPWRPPRVHNCAL